MGQEHLERIDRLAKLHTVSPEDAKCPRSYSQRCLAMEEFRKAFLDINPEIFTASVRIGIMFFLLTFDDACVCEVQFGLNEPSQPLVSHHLREMKKAGWLTSAKRGKWNYYALKPDKREAIATILNLVQEG